MLLFTFVLLCLVAFSSWFIGYSMGQESVNQNEYVRGFFDAVDDQTRSQND